MNFYELKALIGVGVYCLITFGWVLLTFFSIGLPLFFVLAMARAILG